MSPEVKGKAHILRVRLTEDLCDIDNSTLGQVLDPRKVLSEEEPLPPLPLLQG